MKYNGYININLSVKHSKCEVYIYVDLGNYDAHTSSVCKFLFLYGLPFYNNITPYYVERNLNSK